MSRMLGVLAFVFRVSSSCQCESSSVDGVPLTFAVQGQRTKTEGHAAYLDLCLLLDDVSVRSDVQHHADFSCRLRGRYAVDLNCAIVHSTPFICALMLLLSCIF
jgi:hypothetical protein